MEKLAEAVAKSGSDGWAKFFNKLAMSAGACTGPRQPKFVPELLTSQAKEMIIAMSESIDTCNDCGCVESLSPCPTCRANLCPSCRSNHF